MAGGSAIDGVVGRVDVGIGGSVVLGAVVVGATDVVDTSGAVDVVVELAGIVVVVVLVGTVVVVVGVLVCAMVVVPVGEVVVVLAVSEVTVMVDGSADTVTVLGSAVTVTVEVSVGVVVTITVDVEVGATVPGSCTLGVAWTEKLAVAEKLTLIDTIGGLSAEVSVGVAVVDSVDSVAVSVSVSVSVSVPVPVPVSVESVAGWVVPVSVAVSVSERALGTGASLDASVVVLVSATPGWLRTALWSRVCMAGPPANDSALFAATGGIESARTMSVIPIAVVTNAVTTPARDICRRNRSADGPAADRPRHRSIRGRGSASMPGSATWSSLLSTLCIQLLLSPRDAPIAGNR